MSSPLQLPGPLVLRRRGWALNRDTDRQRDVKLSFDRSPSSPHPTKHIAACQSASGQATATRPPIGQPQLPGPGSVGTAIRLAALFSCPHQQALLCPKDNLRAYQALGLYRYLPIQIIGRDQTVVHQAILTPKIAVLSLTFAMATIPCRSRVLVLRLGCQKCLIAHTPSTLPRTHLTIFNCLAMIRNRLPRL